MSTRRREKNHRAFAFWMGLVFLFINGCSFTKKDLPEDRSVEIDKRASNRAANHAQEKRLDASSVRAVIESAQRVQDCYQNWLDELIENEEADDVLSLKGRILVGFLIVEDGAVEAAEIVKSDFGGARFEACILSEISRLVFPDPKDDEAPVPVEVPFFFEPSLGSGGGG